MGFRRNGPLTAFRIVDGRFPMLDGGGAAKCGGRWNSVGVPIVYASLKFAGATLEKRVQSGPKIPANQVVSQITIPETVLIEQIEAGDLPADWRNHDVQTREIGDRWFRERRSVALIVPSAVVMPFPELNVLLNPEHPDFLHILASPPEPVDWDTRLFQ